MFRILSTKETNALQRKCFGIAIPNAFEGVELDGVSYLISVNNKLWRVENGSLLNPTEQEYNQVATNINELSKSLLMQLIQDCCMKY